MIQNFNSKETCKFLKNGELTSNKILSANLIKELDEIEQGILNEVFDFDITDEDEFYSIKNLSQKLVMRKLNDNIKRIYKDEQANRKFIIQQVSTLLAEDCPFWIIKSDIKSFYESVDKKHLYVKLKDDALLSYYSIYLLKKIFENGILKTDGLPRGLSISSTLSELYMRKFDRCIKVYSNVYYYARFVDDIIIFLSNKSSALELYNDLGEKLSKFGNLKLNADKTELIEGVSLKTIDRKGRENQGSLGLDYLGYNFKLDTSQKKERLLITSLGGKKIKIIKTRVIQAYLDFLKLNNFNLLIKRITFLTGNYGIKKSGDGSILKAGIYYNYPHLSDLSILEELNKFHRKVIFSKKQKLGQAINASLSKDQKNKLKKFCFLSGFRNKTYCEFTFREMGQIKKCW